MKDTLLTSCKLGDSSILPKNLPILEVENSSLISDKTLHQICSFSATCGGSCPLQLLLGIEAFFIA
jgi:hypothetical protein